MKTNVSEQRLADAVKKHDQQAMSQLYHQYVGLLSSVCYRYVPCESDVKDILQESFIRIFTSIGAFDYRGEGSLKAWMKRIVVSRALNFLRDNRRLDTIEIDYVATEDMEDTEPEVERLTDDELHEMISSLPNGCRTVLNLYVFEDKSHKEIAEMLGIGIGTSASQLHYAKKLLAHIIRTGEKNWRNQEQKQRTRQRKGKR